MRLEFTNQRNAPNKRLIVNVIAVVLSSCLFVLGQTLILGTLADAPALAKLHQMVVVWLGTVVHGILFSLLNVLVLGLLARFAPQWVRGLIWTLAVLGSTLFVWDYIAYDLVRQHLWAATRLFAENILLDRQIMHTRAIPLWFAVVAYVSTFSAGWFLFSRFETRWPLLKWEASFRSVCLAFFVALIAALGVQVLSRQFIPERVYRASLKSNLSLLSLISREAPASDCIFFIQAPHFHPPPQADISDLIVTNTGSASPRAGQRPDIFFFIIESLRRDCITAEITPNINHFASDCLKINKTVANANQTHYSMSALLHGISPLHHWTFFYRDTYPGAVPVRALKKLGYTIKVLASPDLAYFKLAKATFGKNQRLADFYLDQKDILKRGYKDPGEIDRHIIHEFSNQVSHENSAGPFFYVVMLDSTHIDYYWDSHFKPRFLPYCEQVRVIPIGFDSSKIELLRNRYKNSVAYVDELMGFALTALQNAGRLKRSIVVVTGDHGEEFLERGHVAHSAEPNHFQLDVPILIHLPGLAGNEKTVPLPIASHVDIFPTLFDYLQVTGNFVNSFSGHSLLSSAPPAWAICVQHLADVPSIIVLDNGGRKLWLDIIEGDRVGRSFVAEYLVGSKLLDTNDEDLHYPRQPRQGVPPEFLRALKEVISY